MKWMDAKLAGCYVPGHVLRALKATFPNVSLHWSPDFKRWVLVQRCMDGSSWPFEVLGTPKRYEQPTIANTVGAVARKARLWTRQQRMAYLAQLDASSPTVATEKAAKERVSEGNREMVKHVLSPKTAVRIPWATKSPAKS